MIPNTMKYMAYALFVLNASIIFLCAIWLYKHWWSPQVRFSQPVSLFIQSRGICSGFDSFLQHVIVDLPSADTLGLFDQLIDHCSDGPGG